MVHFRTLFFIAALLSFIPALTGFADTSVSRTDIFRLMTPAPFIVEDRHELFSWQAVAKVAFVSAWVEFHPLLPGRHSGPLQKVVVVDMAPASPPALIWRVPWIDALNVTMVWKAWGADHKLLATQTLPLDYRPAELEGKDADAIYVHLSNHRRQRLYLQRGGRLIFAAYCSGASTGQFSKDGRCGGRIHDHAGWFTITEKSRRHWSSLNGNWFMPYSLRFYRAHHIHGTSPNMYRYLGRPASHGCIRLHRADAAYLFDLVQVGFQVYIY